MCFRQAGLHFLYGEALASLKSEETDRGTRYEVTIDATTDNLDELNDVWALPCDVIDQLKQETGNRRVVIITPLNSTNVTVPVVTPEVTPSPFGVGCRDTDTHGLKTNLEYPLNAVLKEVPSLQKFPVRAGIRHCITACPQSIILSTGNQTPSKYAHSDTATSTDLSPRTTAKQMRTPRDRSARTRDYPRRVSACHTPTHPQGKNTASIDAQAVWDRVPPRWPVVNAALISLSVDGVTHYDSTT